MSRVICATGEKRTNNKQTQTKKGKDGNERARKGKGSKWKCRKVSAMKGRKEKGR